MKEEFELIGADEKLFSVDLTYHDTKALKPVIVFVHGFKGFKDWGHFNLMSEYLAKVGFAVIKFNFSHNGVTPKTPIDFTDLEAFGQNTISKELFDLEVVVNWIFKEASHKGFDFNKLNLIGFSRGGGSSILYAAKDKRVKKLVTWASISDFESRFTTKQIEYWLKEGVLYIPNARTNQQMPLYRSLYDDFQLHKKEYFIKTAVENLNIPYLIIHGEADETVKVKEAKQLLEWKKGGKLVLIKDAGHTFNGFHPWTEKTLPIEVMEKLDHTLDFLNE